MCRMCVLYLEDQSDSIRNLGDGVPYVPIWDEASLTPLLGVVGRAFPRVLS